MKKFVSSFLVTVVCGVYTQAQTADDTLHKAAIAVCDCLTKANLGTNVTEEQLQQAFLSCVLTSAPDLITQIMASGDDYQKAGEEIGTKLSLELMKTGCPAFTKIATSMALQGDDGISIQTEKPTAVEAAEGTVTKVEERDFTYLTLKTNTGRELTFIYYGYVPGSDGWIKDAVTKLKNKNVSVSYVETEVYQPKYKEFMKVKEIKSLTIK